MTGEGAAAGRKIKVTLVKGVGCTREDHRATVRGLGLKRIRHTVELEDTQAVRGLGLRRIRHTVELDDTPAVRGMIEKVRYLVSVQGE
ncbi:MAG TPA: 50S ribosomal protein L30 [Casimicrobiaceae bacterium]